MQLLTANTSKDVWADSAYRSADKVEQGAEDGFREHIQRMGSRNRQLSQGNRKATGQGSKIWLRIEHVFSVQAQRAGNLLLRTVSVMRARAKIGLRNWRTTLTGWGCCWLHNTGEVPPPVVWASGGATAPAFGANSSVPLHNKTTAADGDICSRKKHLFDET